MNTLAQSEKIILLSKFSKKEIKNPEKYFTLVYVFSNGDYLMESLYESKDLKSFYEIRDSNTKERKLNFEIINKNSYSITDNLMFIKYNQFIDILEFVNKNTNFIIRQKIFVDPIGPPLSYNGHFIKAITQNKDIIDLIIQPNRIIKNYFRIYRMKKNEKLVVYKKLIINEGDDPGYIFIDENNNYLLSFIEKATDENNNSKSYILKFDLFTYDLIRKIYIKDLSKFNSNYGFRQELKLYKKAFLFIHNQTIKVFSLEDLNYNFFQIINTLKIQNYQCSTISNLDKSLIISQSNSFMGDKSFLKQYILDEESLEIKEIDSIEVKGFIEDIFYDIDGIILRIMDINNINRFILLKK